MSQRKTRSKSSKVPQASQRSIVVDDDEDALTQSQASQDKSLSHEEENQLVGSVIRYILANDRTKHVIQRQHLVKNVFGNYAKHYRQVMKLVKQTLLQVFGFNLTEFETSKYLVTNAIPNDTPHLFCPNSEQPRRILLGLVLTHIFMSDDICKEELLWAFLRKLTIIADDHFNSNYFGDVRKIITVDFVKQQYLDMLKIGSSEPPLYEFRWGPRAEVEVSKRQVLEFVSKMYHDRPINTWPKQFNALEASDRIDREREDDM